MAAKINNKSRDFVVRSLRFFDDMQSGRVLHALRLDDYHGFAVRAMLLNDPQTLDSVHKIKFMTASRSNLTNLHRSKGA